MSNEEGGDCGSGVGRSGYGAEVRACCGSGRRSGHLVERAGLLLYKFFLCDPSLLRCPASIKSVGS
jgi:hypothetical protein